MVKTKDLRAMTIDELEATIYWTIIEYCGNKKSPS